jgi:hypothetical protein
MPAYSTKRILAAGTCILFSAAMLATVHAARGLWGGRIRPPLWALVCVFLACSAIGAGAVIFFYRHWQEAAAAKRSTFSLSRLLLAMTISAAALAGARDLGIDGAGLGLVVAVPLCVIALVARPDDMVMMVRTSLACCLGMLIANLYTILATTEAYQRNGGDYMNMILGAVGGWAAGHAVAMMWNARGREEESRGGGEGEIVAASSDVELNG